MLSVSERVTPDRRREPEVAVEVPVEELDLFAKFECVQREALLDTKDAFFFSLSIENVITEVNEIIPIRYINLQSNPVF